MEEYGDWRPVPGHDPKRLLVSSKGWLRTKRGAGGLGPPSRGAIQKGHRVVLVQKIRVSKLIASAFIGERPSVAHYLLHVDGDVLNNSVDNLKWVDIASGDGAEWRPVSGINPDKVLVSSLGFVRTQMQPGKFVTGEVRPLGPPTKGHLKVTGYLSVKVDGVQYQVHRLVALAFLGPPPSPSHNTVDHIDQDKQNNSVDNLRWATRTMQAANKSKSVSRFKADADQGDIIDEGEVERWTNVSDRYRVSSMGRVNRLHPKSKTVWLGKATPRPNNAIGGYVMIELSKKGILLHRAIKLAFHGPSEDPTKTTIDHKNGIRHDNRLSNLVWASHKDQANNRGAARVQT